MKLKYILFLVLVPIIVSCSKNWLEPNPLSFYTPSNVYVDQAGFEAGLTTCKKEMNAENHGDLCFIVGENCYSDLAVELRESDWNKLTPSSSPRQAILKLFTNGYGYIKNANTIITRIDDITWDDQSVRNRILSEALWFRAYWYYRLVNTYGDIPWVGEELKEAKLDYFSTKREVILAKLQQDLEYAQEWLPVKAANLGGVTKGANSHLLTKIYLALGHFDQAITSASAVINGPYALMTSRFGVDASNSYHNLMWDLHRWQNKNASENTETIYATVDRPDAAPGTWFNNVGTASMRNYGPSYWKVMDATGNRATNWDTAAGDSLGIGNGDVRTNWFFRYGLWQDEQYQWDETPDMRRAKTNWIEMGEMTSDIITVREGSPNFGQPLTKKYYKNLADTTDTWFSWPYYKVYVPTPNYAQPWGGQGDWYIFRLAETYLLRAEAYFWKGELGLAADDINKVRARANAPLITAAEVTLDYIFDERARELFTEEPRHTEMVRASFIYAKLGKGGYSVETISENNWYYDKVMRDNKFFSAPKYTFWDNTATVHPYNMLWPIPQNVITANTLGRINQNIGYEGAQLNEPPLDVIP